MADTSVEPTVEQTSRPDKEARERFAAACARMAEAAGKLAAEERREFARRLTEELDAGIRGRVERLRRP